MTETHADAIADEELPLYDEVRLALAMSGGLSLAVWMGGVSQELNHLIQQDPTRAATGREGEAVGPYRELLELVRSKPRIDIIAGASAGGLNGALLSMAMVNDRDLGGLRDLWLEKASMTELFRSPFEGNPPSLMKGDRYFLPQLRDAFEKLRSGSRRDPEDVRIRLMMTTTLLTGKPHTFTDDLGSVLPDVVHRGQFTFARGAGVADHFAREDIVDRLAVASRSTASFPGAFEASYVPVGRSTRTPRRPDMGDNVNFAQSRFVLDGGILVNKPIGPVIREILSQPSDGTQVRRVLAYVVPDPGTIPESFGDEEKEAPTLGTTVIAGLVSLPRVESVAGDLDEIVEHNRRALSQRALRERLLAGDPAVRRGMVEQLFPLYRSLRARAAVDALQAYMVPERARAAGLTDGAWAALREEAGRSASAWVPETLPGAGTDDLRWPAGAAEAVGTAALDLIRRAFSLARPADAALASMRERLGRVRDDVNRVLNDVRVLRDLEGARWRAEATDLIEGVEAAGSSTSPFDAAAWIRTWAAGRPKMWEGDDAAGRNPLQDVRELADIVRRAAPDLLGVAGSVAATEGATPGELRQAELVRGMTERLVEHPDGGDPSGIARALLELAVLQYAMAGGMPTLEQPVEFVQVSANTANGFDGRDSVGEKVAGIQLGHFGSFYRRSWRANDWMWGRLDGALRLAQVFLNPARLRLRGLEMSESGDRLVDWAVEQVHRIAVPQDEDAAAVLEPMWKRDVAEIRRQLSFLADAASEPPRVVPAAAQAIARRIQLEILREELLEVARSLDIDEQAGVTLSAGALAFLNGVEDALSGGRRDAMMASLRIPWRPHGRVLPGERLTPEAAARLFGRCRVGEERISGEVGSDLFTTTASTATAVGASAASGSRSGLGPLRPVLAALRTVSLTLYLLARSAVSGSRTGFAVVATLLAAAGAILAFELPSPGGLTIDNPVQWAGVALLVAGVVLAALRAGTLVAAAYVLVAIAAVVLPFVWVRYHLIPAQQKPLEGFWEVLHGLEPAIPIVSLVAVSVILGLLHRDRLWKLWATVMWGAAIGAVAIIAILHYREPSLRLAVVVPIAAALLGFGTAWYLRRPRKPPSRPDRGPGNPPFG